MIAHLLLYSNKVFCISHQGFPVSFCSYFFVRRIYNKKNIWCGLGKPLCPLFNDYLFTIDNINTLRQSINFVSACFA